MMDDSMETFVRLEFRRKYVQPVATDVRSVHDVTLLDGVARALYWQHLLDTGVTPLMRAPGIAHH